MKRGFSLIELMVVIAIVAILAATGVPVYKNYVATAQIATVVSILDSLNSSMIAQYEATGSFPSSMLGSSASSIVSISSVPYVTQGFYDIITTGSGPTAFMTVKFNNYPTTGATEGWMSISVKLVSGVWRASCGQWAPPNDAHAFGDSSKVALLPSGCSTQSVYSFALS